MPPKDTANTQLLKHDMSFTPSTVEEGDEIFRSGIFQWKITNMQWFITEQLEDVEFEWLPVHAFSTDYAKIDQEYLHNVDLNKPIIVVELSFRNKTYLIDGHHRVKKAQTKQVLLLPAYKLKVHQHIPFLISKQGYTA